jgi:CRISPR-associated endonuclease/helicase Cas3
MPGDTSHRPGHTKSSHELLAKPARQGRPGRTIGEHSRDVLEAFAALFGTIDAPTALARCWARFFRLADPADLIANGRAAAVCHDWGKANNGFQEMLEGGPPQLLRHEVVSALLLNHPSVWRWLDDVAGIDPPVVLAAVLGHHLKAREATFGQPGTEADAILCLDWSGLRRQFAGLITGSAQDRALPDDVPPLWSFRSRPRIAGLHDALRKLRDRLETLGDDLEDDVPRRRLLWAVRAALIAADSAGSGLFREGKPVAAWIGAAFDPAGRLDGEAIERKVIRPRLEQIGDRWTGWNPFQEACGDRERVPARALLLAPCGSGKTLAAWRWIAARCAERPIARAIFLYPTRGTATEGYRDYAAHAGPEEAALVHGTAELDIDDIHPDIPDEERIRQARLFALQQWPRRIFSATVDQFLGFLQHGYGPTCLLPLLADSVVVLDEVHSYDRGMFSGLLQFLRHFDVPALCMTATLLPRRRDQLALGSPELGDAGLTIIDGLDLGGDAGALTRIAGYKRYRIATVPDETAAELVVREALAAGKRVLWVVNVVDRAQEIARRFAVDPGSRGLRTSTGVRVFCYHSRYRARDRRRWHGRVVRAFRKPSETRPPRAVLAVTTQVCEMSLDLDADVLVSEYAPATALVQRLGRCCRDMRAHGMGRVGDVVLYPPESKAPYDDHDLLGVDAFVAALATAGLVSQSDLECLLEVVPHVADLPRECRFVESGPWAASGEENFRDTDDRSRPMLLPRDLDEYQQLRKAPRSWKAQELILTAPKGMIDPEPAPGLPAWLGLVNAKQNAYRTALGLCAGSSHTVTLA